MPFRVDLAGALWIRSCFKDLRFFGAARHDVTSPIIVGSPSVGQVSNVTDIRTNGRGIVGGRYQSVIVTNSGDCAMGVLIGHDSGVDITSKGTNMLKWTLAAFWNGTYHSSSDVSTMYTGASEMVTQKLWLSANPHDTGIEAGGPPSLVVQPGESAVVNARMFVSYEVGTADQTETINSGISAIRVYGYNI